MIVELHMLQNFAPSNLNRDDTGSPKDCEFGGYRRARISSQCLKRAMREVFDRDGLIPVGNRAKRTKRLVEEIRDRLASTGKDREQAASVIQALLGGAEIAVGGDGKTQYLLYLGEQEIAGLARLCEQHWDALAVVTTASRTDG